MKLTTAQAIVKYLIAQRTTINGVEAPLFPGVFAIFGHGNVTCLGQALEEARDELPTWRGQNEQGMALAAVGFAKAARRRQIMVATSSIGPGATNMVTAAAVAHANRLPLLLLSGDTFRSRIPDPVLQQVEHFHDPSISVNDAFKAVTRYWDRIVSPEQVVHSLPHARAGGDRHADAGSRARRPRRSCPGSRTPRPGNPAGDRGTPGRRWPDRASSPPRAAGNARPAPGSRCGPKSA
jgi:3D-(3,5/4)-trihydroxycyclohexane-1,2-dione acylhydrolase (decyclizing)